MGKALSGELSCMQTGLVILPLPQGQHFKVRICSSRSKFFPSRAASCLEGCIVQEEPRGSHKSYALWLIWLKTRDVPIHYRRMACSKGDYVHLQASYVTTFKEKMFFLL